MNAVDGWIWAFYERVCEWFLDWLSIDQKWLERMAIATFFAVRMAYIFTSHPPRKLDMAFCMLMTATFYSDHRSPEVTRTARKLNPWHSFARSLLSCSSCFGLILTIIFWRDLNDILWMVSDILFTSCWYLTTISHSGERGRKRQAAIDKIKKLFGTSWIVTPLPQPH